jgi:hypothetical protein
LRKELSALAFHWNKEEQGCQRVWFQTENPNLGKYWRDLDFKMFTYFIAIWNILWTFGILCDLLVHFVLIWYILCSFVTFCVNLLHFVFI